MRKNRLKLPRNSVDILNFNQLLLTLELELLAYIMRI